MIRERKEAEKQKMIDNDPGFSLVEAKAVVQAIEDQLRNELYELKQIHSNGYPPAKFIRVKERGNGPASEIQAELTDKLRFYVNGQKASKVKVIQHICNTSRENFKRIGE